MNQTTSTSSTVVRLVLMAAGVRITRGMIRTLGFRRTILWFGSVQPVLDEVFEPNRQWMAEIAHVSGRPYGASCLDRSVFLWFVMRQHRLNGELRIGVTSATNGIDGHAWVEHEGTVLNDTPDVADRYAVFDGDPVGIVFE